MLNLTGKAEQLNESNCKQSFDIDFDYRSIARWDK